MSVNTHDSFQTLKKSSLNVPNDFSQHIADTPLSTFIILPTSIPRTIWDFFMILLVLYNAFALPFFVGFDVEPSPGLYWFDFVVDIFFYLDIVLNFLTTYEVLGIWETSHLRIARNYMKKWFWVDLISTFPYEVVLALIISNDHQSKTAVVMLKALKNLRLMRLSRLFKFFDRFQSISTWFRMFRLLVGFFLVSHWFACCFHLIGILQGDESWIYQLALEEALVTKRYVTSLYWAFVTITTVGFGDVVPITNTEKIFVMIIMMLGACIYATIFGNISLLIANMGAADNAYRNKMESIGNYMNELDLPEEMQTRVRRFYEHLWLRHRSFQQKDVLMDLPASLHSQISDYIHHEMFAKSSVLVDFNSDFVRSLARKLKFSVSLPNEYIVQEGEAASKLFFISRGVVEVSTERLGRIAFMQDGAWFGDIGILISNQRTATVKALTNCDLYSISGRDLQRILSANPQYDKLFRAIAQARYDQKNFHADDVLVQKTFRDSVKAKNSRSTNPALGNPGPESSKK